MTGSNTEKILLSTIAVILAGVLMVAAVQFSGNKEAAVEETTTTTITTTKQKTTAKKTSKKTTTTTTKKIKQKKTTKKVKKKEKKIIKKTIYKTVSCPKFDLTVISYKILKKGARINSYFKVGVPEFVGVILKGTNKSGKTITIYSNDIELVNSNGEILSPDVLTRNIWGKYRLFNSPKLKKNGSATGYLQYTNNNKDNSNLQLRVGCNDGGLFSEQTYETIYL